jgi:hypothetical protein
MSKDLDILKEAYTEVIWMAIRYAHGRQTFAPSTVRSSIKNFQKVFPDWKPRYDRTLKDDRERMEGSFTDLVALKEDWLDDLVE